MAQSPIATESAISADAASKSVAPTAFSPCNTTAKELAKPTKAVRQPMNRLWTEKSFSMKHSAACGLSQTTAAVCIGDRQKN
ncbi:hypothetical protein D3C71_826950 [compost metagenome]